MDLLVCNAGAQVRPEFATTPRCRSCRPRSTSMLLGVVCSRQTHGALTGTVAAGSCAVVSSRASPGSQPARGSAYGATRAAATHQRRADTRAPTLRGTSRRDGAVAAAVRDPPSRCELAAAGPPARGFAAGPPDQVATAGRSPPAAAAAVRPGVVDRVGVDLAGPARRVLRSGARLARHRPGAGERLQHLSPPGRGPTAPVQGRTRVATATVPSWSRRVAVCPPR